MPRYRFYSDTNQAHFVDEVSRWGAKCVVKGTTVETVSLGLDLDGTARDWGGRRLKDAADTGTSGLAGAGLDDTSASGGYRTNPLPVDGQDLRSTPVANKYRKRRVNAGKTKRASVLSS